MNEASVAFPYPVPEFGAEAYWAACNEGRLVMQRCDTCGKYRWHPAPLCTYCQATAFTWSDLSGRGRVHTWTVVTHPVHPAAVSRVPYVVVEVALEEQSDLTMISNLVGIEPGEIEFDMPLEVIFERHSNGQQIPVFRPAR